MSCRSNHRSSAMTSYARASSGLGDVQTLHLFHRLVGEGRNGAVQAPAGQALEEWQRVVTEQIENDQSISDGQRQRILSRLNNPGDYIPDGPTFYAWQHIRERAREGQGALDQTSGLLGTALGLTPEQCEARVQELEREFDRGVVPSNWQPPAELLARVGEWQSYRMGSAPFYGTRALPQDRRTLYVLATLASNAGVVGNQPLRPATEVPPAPQETSLTPPADQPPVTPAASPTRCPNCGQFAGEEGHNCPAAEVIVLDGSYQGQTLLEIIETEEAGPHVTQEPPAWLRTLPFPDPSGVWNELYRGMPQDDPDDLNAPGSESAVMR